MTPDFKPTEGHWSLVKPDWGTLAASNLGKITRAVKRRLKRIQYRRDLIDGCIAVAGLSGWLSGRYSYQINPPGTPVSLGSAAIRVGTSGGTSMGIKTNLGFGNYGRGWLTRGSLPMECPTTPMAREAANARRAGRPRHHLFKVSCDPSQSALRCCGGISFSSAGDYAVITSMAARPFCAVRADAVFALREGWSPPSDPVELGDWRDVPLQWTWVWQRASLRWEVWPSAIPTSQ
ncbi:hypothetical protein AB0G75_36045 [Streptomyces longwoodensis]